MNASAPIRQWERVLWPAVVVAALLTLWYFAVSWTRTQVFPSPLEVEKGLLELLRKGLLWRYIGDSLRRVLLGFGLATIVGVPLGLMLGWYPVSNQIVNPVFQILRPISPIAWIPVAILFFGVGERSAVFLIFLSAFFPIVVMSVSAVSDVPAVFRRAGRNFGLSPVQLLRRVVLPAALPQILIGLRIALGVAWLVVVAAEMIAVDSGLGYLVIDSRNSGKRYDLVVAAILLIGAIGLVLDSVFRSLEKINSIRWGFRNAT
jgi:NitT/TauT family transport system permease protein